MPKKAKSTLSRAKSTRPRAKTARPRAKTARPRAKTARPRAKTAPRRAKTAPRRAKTAPARAKTAPPRAKTAPPRAISTQTITTILGHMLDPRGIRVVIWDAPVEKYIRGGRQAVRAFFAPLNRAFKNFELNLKPGDLASVVTVKDIKTVIVNWFTSHGYRLI